MLYLLHIRIYHTFLFVCQILTMLKYQSLHFFHHIDSSSCFTHHATWTRAIWSEFLNLSSAQQSYVDILSIIGKMCNFALNQCIGMQYEHLSHFIKFLPTAGPNKVFIYWHVLPVALIWKLSPHLLELYCSESHCTHSALEH